MGLLDSNLKKAVWASLIVHTAALLGFEMAFLNKSESFPVPEPLNVTLLSLASAPIVEKEIVQPVKIKSEPLQTEQPERDTVKPPLESESSIIPLQEILPEKSNLAVGGDSSDKFDFSNSAGDAAVDETENEGPGLIAPVIEAPVPVSSLIPEYPFKARKKGLEGIVVLDLTISDSGDPVSCIIFKSSGFDILDDTAIKTALASRFQPGSIDGRVIQSTLRIRINFQLRDS